MFWIMYVTLIKRARCFELLTSPLESPRSVFNRLSHFYKVSEVFWLVYFTFFNWARCFELFTSLVDSQRSVFLKTRLKSFAINIVCVTFIMRARCFDLFTSLFLSERGVLNYLRHFYKASEVFWIVDVTFGESEKCF